MNQHTAGLMLVAQVFHADGRTTRLAVANGGGLRPIGTDGPLLVALNDKRCEVLNQEPNTTTWKIPVEDPELAPRIYQKFLALRTGWLDARAFRVVEVVRGSPRWTFYMAHPPKDARSDQEWLAGSDLLVAEVSSFAHATMGPTAAPRFTVESWSVRVADIHAARPELEVTQRVLRTGRISRHDNAWRTGQGSALVQQAVREAGLEF